MVVEREQIKVWDYETVCFNYTMKSFLYKINDNKYKHWQKIIIRYLTLNYIMFSRFAWSFLLFNNSLIPLLECENVIEKEGEKRSYERCVWLMVRWKGKWQSM